MHLMYFALMTYYFYQEFLENEGVLAEVNNYYGLIFPITLQYLWTAKPESRDFISVILKKHYFGNEDISEESASAITKVIINKYAKIKIK